ncbi:MAG: (d)CMP kinase [Lachnospiraceae bacterium]|nr:(d)CMP kinase [Lachnospiraceae bacterium]
MQKTSYNIAIDGPAGAGKSTIARLVARRLGFVYVDTGAMYRAMALYFIRQGIGPEDEAAISQAAKAAGITIRYEDGAQQVILNGENVSGLIRSEQVGNMASATSAYPAVRAHLLDLQRGLAACTDVIMDGRDIGTCILPDANAKIFLTASSRVRALRRYKELVEKGEMCNLQEIEQDIIERDQRDMTRKIAPLKQAEDAVLVDGSEMTIEEVADRIIQVAVSHGLKVE